MYRENKLLLFRLSEERRQVAASSTVKFARLPTSAHGVVGVYLSSLLVMTVVCYSAPTPLFTAGTISALLFCKVCFLFLPSFARVR
jgi:hypothetical protein